jgi:adenylate cyclase
MSFITELKRRNVIRVGVAYLVACWLLLQIVDVLVPILDLPDWVGKLVFLVLVVGLIPALVFSWAYEMTSEGLRRESEVETDEAVNRYTARRLDRITITLLVVVVSIVALDRFIPETSGPINIDSAKVSVGDALDERPSVAVIPFVNMSDDASNEYFSDGISEELLNLLVRIRGLRVPSRTSSFTFKNSNQNLFEIGEALDVVHVLEGSVRKAGNRIRVTAQLTDVATDTQLWSETYTREINDIFAIQEEIAQAIVDALQITLSGSDQEKIGARATENVQAYNEYLVAKHLWSLRTPQSLRSAIEHLQKAVELDADYDEAWVSIADTYVVMLDYYIGSIDENIPLARKALEQALAINPGSARALAVMASIKGNFDYDWEGSNADFEKSLLLAPDDASTHQWFGEILNIQRRTDEALLQLQLARRADPVSMVVRHVPGYILLWALRLDEAEARYNDALALGGQPLRWTLHNLDILHTLRGDYDDARQRARQLAALEGFDPAADLARIDAVENPALKERALELLRERQDISDGVFGKALHYALLDEFDLALESLEAGFANGDPLATAMNYVQLYDPLRDNPRFQAMLEKMNLWP